MELDFKKKTESTPRIMSVAFSAIMITGAFMFPEMTFSIIEASTTRRPLMPRTLSSESTTAVLSFSLPILHVPVGWYTV